jgi:uncharacterized protein
MEPQRTCVGCRTVRSKSRLVRLQRESDGRVRLDRRQRGPGRGVYVCPCPSCLELALTGRRLGHAFRRPTEPPSERAALIREILG